MEYAPFYLPSADNPADDPTRNRQLRVPEESDIVPWVHEALKGNLGPVQNEVEHCIQLSKLGCSMQVW